MSWPAWQNWLAHSPALPSPEEPDAPNTCSKACPNPIMPAEFEWDPIPRGITAKMFIELIARGVLLGPRGILLCRNAGMDYTYLPGGHVEFGESATAALEREIFEELALHAKAGNFLGVIEHTFTQAGVAHHEISLVFELTGSAIARRARLTPAESRLEFVWQPLHTLSEANLLPRPLRQLVPIWTRGKHAPFHSDMIGDTKSKA